MHVDLPQKLYYSIGEVSKAFNVNASLIRFWEKEFEYLNPKKNVKGTRRYSSMDIEKLQVEVADNLGFKIIEHSLYIYGDCSKKACPHKAKR